MLNMIIGALLFVAGYFLCYFTQYQKTDKPQNLLTTSKFDEKYKDKTTNLYKPVKVKATELRKKLSGGEEDVI